METVIIWAWLACHKDKVVESALPDVPQWFEVGPGEALCLSSVPEAGPLSGSDRGKLAAAVAALRARSPEEALAPLQSAGDHPAIAHARAVQALMVGDETALDKLVALSAANPGDVCLAVTGALASAGKGDLATAASDVQRARTLAPAEPNVALLSWYMQLEDPTTLVPLLVEVADTNPAAAYVVGLERFSQDDPSCVDMLARAAEGGLEDALGPLLFAYRTFHRMGEYLQLASELELLRDNGRLARARDPVAEYKQLLSIEPGQALVATFQTSMGDFSCRLLHEVAPVTVANFVGLARGSTDWTDPRDNTLKHEPLYDGTVFHRVIPDFMIQGGDPLGLGTGDAGYRFHDEVDEEVRFDKPGRLAMANAGPNTNGSQFFVTEVAVPQLDGNYTIFGDCGEDSAGVVSKIARVPKDENDKPTEPVTLEHVEIKAIASASP
jgi:peptidyl-prolyl cis-trans isomerase A (cyclophilin A)